SQFWPIDGFEKAYPLWRCVRQQAQVPVFGLIGPAVERQNPLVTHAALWWAEGLARKVFNQRIRNHRLEHGDFYRLSSPRPLALVQGHGDCIRHYIANRFVGKDRLDVFRAVFLVMAFERRYATHGLDDVIKRGASRIRAALRKPIRAAID